MNFNLEVLASLYSSSPQILTEVIAHGLLDVSGGESSQILAGSDAPSPWLTAICPMLSSFGPLK